MAYTPVAQAPLFGREVAMVSSPTATQGLSSSSLEEGSSVRVASPMFDRPHRSMSWKLAVAGVAVLVILGLAGAYASATGPGAGSSHGAGPRAELAPTSPGVVARLYAAPVAPAPAAPVAGAATAVASPTPAAAEVAAAPAAVPVYAPQVAPPAAADVSQVAAQVPQAVPPEVATAAPAMQVAAAAPAALQPAAAAAAPAVAAVAPLATAPPVPGAPPANAAAAPGSTLYCFALALSTGYELDLLRKQQEKKASIFACEATTIFSNVTVPVGNLNTYDLGMNLAVELGGKWGTALNTDVFIRVWGAVKYQGLFRNYDWSIKADPDTVFFPERFRDLVTRRTTNRIHDPVVPAGAVYLDNCHYGLHGPLEAISRDAMIYFLDHNEVDCQEIETYAMDNFPYGPPAELDDSEHAFGEDEYLARCLKHLGIAKVDEFDSLLVEQFACDQHTARCEGAKVSFHAYKTEELWFQCWNDARNWNEWPFKEAPKLPDAPTQAPGVPPPATPAPEQSGSLLNNVVNNVRGFLSSRFGM